MHARPIVIVAFDGVQPLDVAGPHEVFCGATRAAASLGLEGWLPGGRGLVRRGPARSAADRAVSRLRSRVARCPLAGAPLDTLVLAGGSGVEDGRRRRRSCSPGSAGVSGRTAGVSPRCARARSSPRQPGFSRAAGSPPTGPEPRQLGDQYPALTVDADPIYVQDGRYWSSAGVTAGIDLSLALVEEDLGVEVAQSVARWLVMFLHRPGGQTQFASPVWVPRAERSTIRAVQSAGRVGSRRRPPDPAHWPPPRP